MKNLQLNAVATTESLGSLIHEIRFDIEVSPHEMVGRENIDDIKSYVEDCLKKGFNHDI